MAAPSTFSYAQAAKGQGASPSNTQADAAAQSPAPAPAEKSADAVETPAEPDAVRPPVPEKQESENVPESDADARSESVQERRSETKRDDDSERLNRPWRRNDRGTRSSSVTTRSVDEQDTRKPRRGKRTKASEKQASEQSADKEQEAEPEPPKIELSEAPIPTVNIWHQRKEAQQAKVKPSHQDAARATAEYAEDVKKTTKPNEDTAEVVASRDGAPLNGVRSARKVGDAVRPERNGSRGSRLSEKEAKDGKTVIPPSVEDAAAWPTPEIAIQEDKKKTAEKTDRPDVQAQDDASQSKPRQKEKWITYDYVPSVAFETPVHRGSKPRGGARPSNSSRQTPAQQTTDKAPSAASAAPTKSNEAQKQPRESANGANGAALPPQQGKRPVNEVPNGREPRKPANNAGADRSKDSAPNQAAEPSHPPRDRAEGRGDRGRGAFRGRGGNHFGNSHPQHQQINTGPGFNQPGGVAPRTQGPYSPPSRQGSHGQMYMPPSQRGGRGGRNGGSGNYHRMSLPNGSSRVPPVQTQFGAYDYPMPPMTAMPFQNPPYWDNVVVPLLKSQVEYYFSIENLCKDMYLRRRMDSQGFVPLHFIAAFKRMRELSTDMGLVRAVCEDSNEVDFIVGDDDCERLRRRTGWETFVLPMGQRDELARNHGPNQFSFKSRGYQFGHPYNGMPPMPYGMASPPAYPVQGEFPYQQFPEDMVNGHGFNGVNGMVNGQGGSSQLSAEVPDFSPSRPDMFGQESSKAANAESHVEGNANHLEGPNGHVSGTLPNGLTNGVHSTEAQE